MHRWQSGQMQRTVNPPTSVYEGSNPSLCTKVKEHRMVLFCFIIPSSLELGGLPRFLQVQCLVTFLPKIEHLPHRCSP